MLGVSIGLGVDSLQAGDELNDECGEDRLGCSSDYDFESARSREVTGFGVFVGFGIGGLLATGAGAIGLGLGLSEPSRGEVSVSPWSVPGGGGLSVSGRF